MTTLPPTLARTVSAAAVLLLLAVVVAAMWFSDPVPRTAPAAANGTTVVVGNG